MFNTKTLIIAITAIGGLSAAMPAQAARNYDCSKAGNARLAVCKGAAPAAPTAAKPALVKPVAKPVVAAARPAAPAAPRVAAAPRAAAHPATTNTVAWTTKTGKTVHYNCAKTGNANKQACH